MFICIPFIFTYMRMRSKTKFIYSIFLVPRFPFAIKFFVPFLHLTHSSTCWWWPLNSHSLLMLRWSWHQWLVKHCSFSHLYSHKLHSNWLFHLVFLFSSIILTALLGFQHLYFQPIRLVNQLLYFINRSNCPLVSVSSFAKHWIHWFWT